MGAKTRSNLQSLMLCDILFLSFTVGFNVFFCRGVYKRNTVSFTYSQMVITKQAGDILYSRSYNLKVKTCKIIGQNMYGCNINIMWREYIS